MKLVLVDRDGVINEDSDDYVTSVAQWRPIPGSLDAIARLCRAGFRVAVVSNQSGLARGLFDREALDAIHVEMCRRVEACDGRIDGIFFCPHLPDAGCACRKPGTALLERAAEALGAKLAGAALVGDKREDLEAARRAGCEPLLVRTGKGNATLEAGVGLEGARVFEDLAGAADFLIARQGTAGGGPAG